MVFDGSFEKVSCDPSDLVSLEECEKNLRR